MVIVPDPRGLVVVRQYDHAAMSAQAALLWKRPPSIPESLWPRFLDAVGRHDDGWIPEEDQLSLDAGGRPHDFKTLPAPLHVAICRRSVERSRGIHTYVTLLVAQHCRALYRQRPLKPSRADQAISDRFVDELSRTVEATGRDLRRQGADGRLAAEPENLERARRLLAFLDGLSLILLGALPVPERADPIQLGDAEREVRVVREGSPSSSGGRALLDPWPFSSPALDLEVPALVLGRETFRSTDDLRAALPSARVEPLRFRVSPGA